MPDRFIRESICVSDTLNQLSDFEERFWHRLIVNCDDFGRFDARPAVLKGKLFPLMDGKTKKDMSDALNKLASVGLVELYEVDGKPFLHVVKWSKYQRTRATKSKYPSPDDANSRLTTPDSKCCQVTANVPVCECECDIRPSKCECDTRTREAAGTSAPISGTGVAIRPTFEQVLEYAKFRGAEQCARPFFDYYDAAGWRDGQNIPVYNWQQKFIAWQMREEQRKKRGSKKQQADPQPSQDRIQRNNNWLDAFLAEQEGGTTGK